MKIKLTNNWVRQWNCIKYQQSKVTSKTNRDNLSENTSARNVQPNYTPSSKKKVFAANVQGLMNWYRIITSSNLFYMSWILRWINCHHIAALLNLEEFLLFKAFRVWSWTDPISQYSNRLILNPRKAAKDSTLFRRATSSRSRNLSWSAEELTALKIHKL